MKQAFIVLVVLLSINARAQKTYSISIDADGDQFFSVAIGKKNYSSSSIGHLSIPSLKDSTYQLTVSFPRSTYAVETFIVDMDKADKSFQLKKNADKTWSLLDVKSKTFIKSKNSVVQAAFHDDVNAQKTREAFARLMAGVVNDTAVLNTRYDKPVAKKPAVVNEVLKDTPVLVTKKANDTAAKKSDTAVAKSKIEKPATPAAVAKKPQQSDSLELAKRKQARLDSLANAPKTIVKNKKFDIRKLEDVTSDAGREMIFLDSTGGKKYDTVKILIPLSADSVRTVEAPKVDTVKKAKDTVLVEKIDDHNFRVASRPVQAQDSVAKPAIDTVKKPEVGDTLKKAELITEVPKPKEVDTPKQGTKKDPVIKDTSNQKKLVIINSDCKNFATDADLDKLRVKMIAENSLDERIIIAKKVFKTKCFTTKQIRALTELFVSDKTRYQFFDAAYPFVSDTGSFKSLVELLTDEYYIGRFKAMVRM